MDSKDQAVSALLDAVDACWAAYLRAGVDEEQRRNVFQAVTYLLRALPPTCWLTALDKLALRTDQLDVENMRVQLYMYTPPSLHHYLDVRP